MQPQKIEPQIITARQAEQENKLHEWLVIVGNIAFWLSVILFINAFIDAVDICIKM